MDLKDEIDTMNKSFNEGLATEAPATESVTTTAPQTEAPVTETVTTDAPTTSAPTTSAPATEPPAVDEKDKVIEDLRRKLADKEKKSAPTTSAPATEPPFTIADKKFLDDIDDIEDIIHDKDKLEELFSKVYKSAVMDTKKVLGESVLRQIPDIVKANLVIQTNLKSVRDKFYEENKDLEPFKKVVGVVFEELAAENPDKKYDEILSKVGPEVRKRLDLTNKVVSNEKQKSAPKLPATKGGSPRGDKKPDVSPMEKELSEMSESLGR